jgi:hypothetical protein
MPLRVAEIRVLNAVTAGAALSHPDLDSFADTGP